MQPRVRRRHVLSHNQFVQSGLKKSSFHHVYIFANFQRVRRNSSHLHVRIGPGCLQRKRRDHNYLGTHERLVAITCNSRRILNGAHLFERN